MAAEDDLNYKVRSLKTDLEHERREAWRNESHLYAAILIAIVAVTAFLFARQPTGFSKSTPMWEKVGVFFLIAWVVAVPVLGAIWLLSGVISAFRRWRGDGHEGRRVGFF